MQKLDRRSFLIRSQQAGLALAAGSSLLTLTQSGGAAAPSEKLILGMVGVRGRGAQLAAGFAERGDCEIAYIADVDQAVIPPCAEAVAKLQGKTPKAVQDFRRILDDKSVDAIVVATPDHWHALATVWGCQAGKDVYVEKPASHSPWEGRKMVEAARKYNRIVELGTQCRSAPYLINAKKYLDSGKLGKIHYCRVYNQKEWGNVQAVPDADPPASLDWNMWNGPAPEARFNANYWRSWNHFWKYSGGDSINDAIHQLDVARWMCGVKIPKTVYSVGGRFAEPGCLETPDTQIAAYEFDDLVLTFELTLYTPYMIKSDMALREGDIYPYWPQNGTRIEIYGTEALMIVGRHGDGWQVYGRQHQRNPVILAQEKGRFPDKPHKADFVDAVRTRRRPNADIEEGHISTLLSQFANISYRLGGQKLLVDAQTETFTNSSAGNALLKREYRKPWAVPEQV